MISFPLSSSVHVRLLPQVPLSTTAAPAVTGSMVSTIVTAKTSDSNRENRCLIFLYPPMFIIYAEMIGKARYSADAKSLALRHRTFPSIRRLCAHDPLYHPAMEKTSLSNHIFPVLLRAQKRAFREGGGSALPKRHAAAREKISVYRAYGTKFYKIPLVFSVKIMYTGYQWGGFPRRVLRKS